MAAFDVVESAGYGYQTFWTQRFALMRLMALPYLVKLGSYALLLFLGLEDNFLRHGLVLLPSFFAEGFLIAYVVRTVAVGGDLNGDFAQSRSYARDIMAAMIVYVMIQLAGAFFIGSFMTGITQGGEAPQPAEPSLVTFFGALIMLASVIWAFRLLWLHVPVALGISAKAFLLRIKAYSSSFYLFGCWMLCFIPFGIFMLLVSELMAGLFPSTEEEVSMAFSLAVAVVQSGVELIMALVSSLAIAYGVKQIMEQKQ